MDNNGVGLNAGSAGAVCGSAASARAVIAAVVAAA
jgi:hypothetical protein